MLISVPAFTLPYFRMRVLVDFFFLLPFLINSFEWKRLLEDEREDGGESVMLISKSCSL